MAEATEMTLTGVRSARIGEERREVRLSVTYALDKDDDRMERVTAVKMTEVERGITAAWKALQRREDTETFSCESVEADRTAPEPVSVAPDDEEVYPEGYHRDENSGDDENGEEPQDGDDGEPFPAHPSQRRPDCPPQPREMNPAHTAPPVPQYVPPITHYVPPAPAEPVVYASKVQLLAIRPLLTKLNFTSNDTRDLLQKFFKKWTLERLTRDEANDLLVSLRRGDIEIQQKRQGASSPGMNGSYTNGSRAH